MPGPNTWMSTPTPAWAQTEKHLGPTKVQLHRLKLKGNPQEHSSFNPGHGLKKHEIPGAEQVQVDNLSIPGRDGSPIKVRIYTPTNSKIDHFPVLTWAHHGGWKLGNLDTEDPTCRYIAVHCIFVVVSISYALVPNRFPIALNNVHDVVNWIAYNHTTIKVDPTRGFILGGASAGANMSAVITHLTKPTRPFPITGQLYTSGWFLDHAHAHHLDVPPSWIEELTSVSDNADAPLISRDTITAILSPSWLSVPDSSDPRFSPALFPRASFDAQPPMYIQVAGMDPFRDDGLLYAKLVRRGGAEVSVSFFPGVPHAWFEFSQLPETRRFVPDLVKGIRWLQEVQGRRKVTTSRL